MDPAVVCRLCEGGQLGSWAWGALGGVRPYGVPLWE